MVTPRALRAVLESLAEPGELSPRSGSDWHAATGHRHGASADMVTRGADTNRRGAQRLRIRTLRRMIHFLKQLEAAWTRAA